MKERLRASDYRFIADLPGAAGGHDLVSACAISTARSRKLPSISTSIATTRATSPEDSSSDQGYRIGRLPPGLAVSPTTTTPRPSWSARPGWSTPTGSWARACACGAGPTAGSARCRRKSTASRSRRAANWRASSIELPEDAARPAATPAQARALAEDFLRDPPAPRSRIARFRRGHRRARARIASTARSPGRSAISTWTTPPTAWRSRVLGNEVGGYREYLKIPEQWTRDYQRLRSKNEVAATIDTAVMLVLVVGMVIVDRAAGAPPRRALAARRAWSARSAIVLALPGAVERVPAARVRLSHHRFVRQFPLPRVSATRCSRRWAAGGLLFVLTAGAEPLYRETVRRQDLARQSLHARAACAPSASSSAPSSASRSPASSSRTRRRSTSWPTSTAPGRPPTCRIPICSTRDSRGCSCCSAASCRPSPKSFCSACSPSRFCGSSRAAWRWRSCWRASSGASATPAIRSSPSTFAAWKWASAAWRSGIIMLRCGILPTLVWHYSVDAMYSAMLLVRSHSLYFKLSGCGAAGIMVLPVSIALAAYWRRGGFEPETGLLNRDDVAEPGVQEAAAARTPRFDRGRRRLRRRPIPSPTVRWAPACAGRRRGARPRTRLARHPRRPLRRIARLPTFPRPGARRRRRLPQVAGPRSRRLPARHLSRRPLGGARFPRRQVLPGAPPSRAPPPPCSNATVPCRSGSRAISNRSTRKRSPSASIPKPARSPGFSHTIPETAPGADIDLERAREIAAQFANSLGWDTGAMDLKESSTEEKKARRDYSLEWEARPGDPRNVDETRWRVEVNVAGDRVTSARGFWKLPEAWQRGREQQNALAIAIAVLRIVTLAGSHRLWLVAAHAGHASGHRPLARRHPPRPARDAALPRRPAALLGLMLKNYRTDMPLETFQAMTYVIVAMSVIFGFLLMGAAAALSSPSIPTPCLRCAARIAPSWPSMPSPPCWPPPASVSRCINSRASCWIASTPRRCSPSAARTSSPAPPPPSPRSHRAVRGAADRCRPARPARAARLADYQTLDALRRRAARPVRHACPARSAPPASSSCSTPSRSPWPPPPSPSAGSSPAATTWPTPWCFG